MIYLNEIIAPIIDTSGSMGKPDDYSVLAKGSIYANPKFIIHLTVGKKSGKKELYFYYRSSSGFDFTKETALGCAKILELCPEAVTDKNLRDIELPPDNQICYPNPDVFTAMSVYAKTEVPWRNTKNFDEMELKINNANTFGEALDATKRLADKYKHQSRFDL